MTKYQDPKVVQHILNSSRTIAIVGLSTNHQKASHIVARFLQKKGFKIIPVHPKADWLLGEKVYKKVTDIREPVDIVNVFRPSHEGPEYAKQAVQIGAKTLWLQLNLFSEEAATIAHDSGLNVIMNLCIKIEHSRLHQSPNA